MSAVAGVRGAVYDDAASNKTGGCDAGVIAVGHNSTTRKQLFPDGLTTVNMASAPGKVPFPLFPCAFPGKLMRYSLAAADVAVDGVVVAGFLNRTGKVWRSGEWGWAVTA